MARVGLGPAFAVTFANDRDPAKARQYDQAFGPGVMRCADVWSLTAADLPGRPALAWASFPCQDLSLAGARGGLDAPRSGAFWGFWRLIGDLESEGRAPDVAAIENVAGLVTSRGGADFAALAAALVARGYWFGAVTLDAAAFVPQSRPRLFIAATRRAPPPDLVRNAPDPACHSAALVKAVAHLPDDIRQRCVWWRLPPMPVRNTRLADILDDDSHAAWRPPAHAERLLALMSPRQRDRVAALRAAGGRHVGALFRRIRIESGVKMQRAEVRFDGLAGCLRTPAGGSSRQTLLVIEDGTVRARLVSPREAARLMGLPEEYPLPAAATAALHLLGDGVAVPVVRFLSDHLLTPLAVGPARGRRAA